MEKIIYKQFHEIEEKHWWFRGIYSMFREALARYIIPAVRGKRGIILDIGCGTGYWTEGLSGLGTVVALDNAIDALAICRKRGLPKLIQARAGRLPLAGESCDAITIIGVIEHVEDDNGLLKEIKRVLKPGGRALMLTSAHMFLWGAHDDLVHHVRRYSKKSLTRLIKNGGLRILKISYVNMFLFLPVLMMRITEHIVRRRESSFQGSSDLFLPPAFLNTFFYKLLRLEALLLKRFSLPFGVSMLAVFEKDV